MILRDARGKDRVHLQDERERGNYFNQVSLFTNIVTCRTYYI